MNSFSDHEGTSVTEFFIQWPGLWFLNTFKEVGDALLQKVCDAA